MNANRALPDCPSCGASGACLLGCGMIDWDAPTRTKIVRQRPEPAAWHRRGYTYSVTHAPSATIRASSTTNRN